MSAVSRYISVRNVIAEKWSIRSTIAGKHRFSSILKYAGTTAHFSLILNRGLTQNRMAQRATQNRTAQRDNEKAGTTLIDCMQNFQRSEPYYVKQYMEELKHTSTGSIGPTNANLLISAVGSAMVSTPAHHRHNMFNEAWQLLKKSNYPITTYIYNTGLATRIQNQQTLVPTEELRIMHEEYGLKANSITFQLLIDAYCRQGDVDNAKTIVDHMKSEELSVREPVYASLVTGYLVNNDVTSAKAVFTTMQEAGIVPSAQTLQPLLNYYAGTANYTEIENLLREAEEEFAVGFDHHQYHLEMVLHAARNGHDDIVHKLMSSLPRREGFVNAWINTVLRLVTEGKTEASYKVLTHEGLKSPGLALTYQRALIRNEVPIADIKQITSQLRELYPSVGIKDSFGSLLDSAIENCSMSYIMELKKHSMGDKQEHPGSRKCSWILERMYLHGKDVRSQLHEIVPHIPASDMPTAIYEKFLIGELQIGTSIQDICATLESLPESGSKLAAGARFLGAVYSGKYDDAKTLASDVDPDVYAGLAKCFAIGFRTDTNWDQVTDILAALPSTNELNAANGLVFMKAVGIVGESGAQMLAEKFRKKDIKIAAWYYTEYMKENLPPEISKIVGSDDMLDSREKFSFATRPPQADRFLSREDMMKLSISDLESLANTTKNDARLKILRSVLYEKYCIEGPAEKLDEAWEAMISVNEEIRLRQLKFKARAEVVHKNNVESAIEMLNSMCEKYKSDLPDFRYFAKVTLPVAKKMIELGDMPRAMECLAKVSEKVSEKEEDVLAHDNAGHLLQVSKSDVSDLLKASLAHHDISTVVDILQALLQHRYINQQSLIYYVRGMCTHLIDQGTTTDAFAFLEHCVTTLGYNIMKHMHPFLKLLCKVIKEDDAALVQKVADLILKEAGEVKQINMLLIAFLETGNILKARRLVQKFKVGASWDVVFEAGNIYRREGNVETLEHMLDTMEHMPGVDNDFIVRQIIRTHCDKKDWQLATDALEKYSHVSLRDATVNELYDTLVANGEQPTFDRRESTPRSAATRPQTQQPTGKQQNTQNKPKSEAQIRTEQALQGIQTANEAEEELLSMSKEQISTAWYGQLKEQAAAIADYLEQSHEKISDVFLASLVEALQDTRSLVTRNVLVKIASLGRLDAVAQSSNIKPQVLNRAQDVQLAISGRTSELLDRLRQDPSTLVHLDCTVINHLHETDKEAFNTVESLLNTELENSQETQLILSRLVHIALLRDDYTTLQRLIERHVDEAKGGLPYVEFVSYAVKTNQREALMKLLDILDQNSLVKSAQLYTSIIDLCCNAGDFTAAMDMYKQAMHNGIKYRSMLASPKPYLKLQKHLQDTQQAVPWPEDLFERPRNANRRR